MRILVIFDGESVRETLDTSDVHASGFLIQFVVNEATFFLNWGIVVSETKEDKVSRNQTQIRVKRYIT